MFYRFSCTPSRNIHHLTSNELTDSIFKYFKWKDLKSIYVDDKELFIKHDDSLSINGNVTGKIKTSSSEDIIIRSIIELKAYKKEPQTQTIHEKMEIESVSKNKRSNNGLFRGERIREREKSLNSTEVLSQSEKEQRIAKRGFEIDTTF